jgi:dihydroxyacetone kinase-like predicted kinase
MSDFLKGNYKVDVVIKDDKSEERDEFRENALNSIGGSMVFVERERMIWSDDEDQKCTSKKK